MKRHAMKKGLSALCMVLALCMVFQSATLAADISADTSAASSAVSEETDTTESPDTNTAEEAEADASTSEEAEAEEEVPVEEADPSAEDAEAAETDGEAETEAEAEAEEDALVTAQATVATGWAQATDDEDGSSYWTFSYKENSTSTTATLAADEVLYIPKDITVDATTFTKGYYYFDEDGKLVADGETASVGVLEVLKYSSNAYLCDDSSDDSGKVMQVVTTQTTAADGAVTVSSSADYYTGPYKKLYYSNGELYTGYYINPSTGILYYMTDGTYVRFTGQFKTSETSTYGSTTYTGDGLWYYKGVKFTGYVRRYASDYVWVVTDGKGGTKLTGVASTSKYYVRMDTGKRVYADGKYYKNGKVYTGVVSNYLYIKGVKQTYKSTWKTYDSSGNVSSKSSGNTYYFNSSGKVVTGWNTLKRNGTSYRFYFNSDGTLCKNLYKVNSAYKKKSTKLVISRGTHTATLYAKYGSSYSIPCKSFVVSTSKKESNFKAGTYKLSSRKSWFKIDGVRWWYKWATYISGSGSWCHSEQYYTKGDGTSMRVGSYNELGTNQSKQCIRMQVVNAKLIYDMKGYGSITTVVLNKSTNAGPFGKMTITDNVDKSGKLSGSTTYDPTDPAYT